MIAASASARIVVEAGPGYGKTDVACARVAHLLANGLTGAQILLLSFTRTAVRELRLRIAQLAATNADVRGVEIRTIDSFAWGFNRGLAAQGVADLGSYEDSIQRSLQLFAESGDAGQNVEEALGRYAHVLVDEAQDLVGVRAEWVLAFLARLGRTVGWTVFMDPAQAIYDWAEECGREESEPLGFVDLHAERLGQFERVPLRTFHRTANVPLATFLHQVRSVVPRGETANTPANLRAFILNEAKGEGDDPDIYDLARRVVQDRDGGLILFRTRAEALSASSFLGSKDVQHRLRFGGLPRLVAPWVASVINRIGQLRFDRKTFDEAWHSIATSTPYLVSGWDAEDAWRALVRLGRPAGVPLRRVREIQVDLVADSLAQRRVPDELFRKELGPGGPIIGTVHGSKGREAGHVVCCVSDRGREGRQEAEDERVLYVGVSRARNNLEIVKAPPRRWYYSEGRAWRQTFPPSPNPYVQIEVGRDGDFDYVTAAHAPQRVVASFDGAFRSVTMRAMDVGGGRWEKKLFHETTELGSLSRSCSDHLNTIMQGACEKHCNYLGHLQWIDVTTAAIGANDSRVPTLPEPCRRTRVWLAPIIVGIGFTRKWQED